MSLLIDNRFVTGIYAFNQWFKVKKNTVDVDAYEFISWDDSFGDNEKPNSWDDPHAVYQMGAVYDADRPGLYKSAPYGGESRGSFVNPSGCTGITFIDADTNERISFSILEVKAFREDRS